MRRPHRTAGSSRSTTRSRRAAPVCSPSPSGAVATSTKLRRHWTRGDRTLHHLIDPRTGEPAESGLASVTVVAGEAWRAEVLAKAAFVAGAADGAALIEAAGATGMLVTDDGDVVELDGLGPSFRP